jgi:predicted small lipoprotein YifL
MSCLSCRRFILISPLVLLMGLGLSGCGQRGPLYIPKDPAAANRATLPQTVFGRASAAPAARTTPPLPAPSLEPAIPDVQDIQ